MFIDSTDIRYGGDTMEATVFRRKGIVDQ